MKKPELLKKDAKGGTIHSYQLTGGLHTYDRYLACNKGVCTFYNSFELREKCLEKMT
jgi:hypothetical protein